jgi:Transposase
MLLLASVPIKVIRNATQADKLKENLMVERVSANTLNTTLLGLLGMSVTEYSIERQGLRRVGMDMWGPYRGVVKAKRSQAKIVADGFHVMKQLNDAIAKICRNLQAKADKASYELFKGMRWILVRNRTDLEPAEEAKLLAALVAFPELRPPYLLKEHFATLVNKIKDRSQAELTRRPGCMRPRPLL